MLRIAVPLGCLVLALAGCAHGIGASDTDQTAYDESVRVSRLAIGGAPPTCESQTKVAVQLVRYIGPTDEAFAACVGRFAKKSGVKLEITSPGGPVDIAIAASYLVALQKWDVVVRGVCASSCANYVVPAARRLTVLPYSVIFTHGRPELGDEAGLRSTIARQTGLAGADLDRLVRDTIRRSQTSVDAHTSFAGQLGIGEFWFALDPRLPVREARRAGTAPSLLAMSPEMYAACVGKAPQFYWFPANEDDWKKIEKLTAYVVERPDRGSPYQCR